MEADKLQIKLPRHQIEPSDTSVLARSRIEIAKALTRFVSGLTAPFVLAIDGRWGSGKTTFLDFWSQRLKEEGFVCVRFNAWTNDFSDDPLVGFIAEMQNELVGTDPKGAIGSALDKVLKLSRGLIKRAVPVAVKVATYGALDVDKATEVAFGDAFGKTVEDAIKDYENRKNTLARFRGSLAGVAKAAQEEHEGRPLLFLVDELDRCRPLYAITLLEHIKHLFDLPGVVFVLAIDQDQLCHSIRSLYGSGMDAEAYLRRFVELRFPLPDLPPEEFARSLWEHYGVKTFISNGWPQHATSLNRQVLETFPVVAQVFRLSLRDQEYCFRQIVIALLQTLPPVPPHPVLVASLAALHLCDPQLYTSLCRREPAAEKAILGRFSENPAGRDFLMTDLGVALEASLFLYRADVDQVSAKISEQSQVISAHSKPDPQKKRAKVFLAFLQTHTPGDESPLDCVIRRLNMASETGEP